MKKVSELSVNIVVAVLMVEGQGAEKVKEKWKRTEFEQRS